MLKKKFNIFAFFAALLLLAACQTEEQIPETISQTEAETAGAADETKAAPVKETAIAPADVPTEPPASPKAEVRVEALNEALSAELTTQLDAFLQSQVYREGGNPEGAAPGLILLVDTPQGSYLNAAGVSSLEDGTPLRVDDRLEIGSNSKSFTIAVLMQLQEEGLLSLDDLLIAWLPDLADQIPNGEQITLRQLAAHTSGIWDYGDPIIGEAAQDPDKLGADYTPQELVQYAIENGTPDFEPEAGWKYSNTGYILLGMVAEKASGQPLGELYRERIFEPLGLETAALIPGVPEAGEITSGYWYLEDGTRLNTTYWNVSQSWAAGGIAMTAEELATYGKALAAGELFKDPDSLAQMLAFNEAAVPLGGGAFGLGLIDFGSGYWGHEGQTAGFQTLWYTNPKEGVTVVGLTNSAAYSAYSFLNVINILNGRGLQPLMPVTLLPIADQAPQIYTSRWEWRQAIEDSNVIEIPPGFILSLSKDSTASISSYTCGPIEGSFTADDRAQITFEFDLSAVTCAAGDPLLQLAEAL